MMKQRKVNKNQALLQSLYIYLLPTKTKLF